MANRYLLSYQCFAGSTRPVFAIVPNALKPWALGVIFGEKSAARSPHFLSSPKTACYPSCYQRVEDAAVKKRRASR